MFKRYIILSSIIAMMQFTGFSQNHIDALRFSQQFYNATAKSTAMGNSLSAVGADFSAATVNPAGLGVLNSSMLTFSPNFIINSTQSDFLSNSRQENKYGMTVNNFGFAGVNNRSGSALKQVTFAIIYNRLNEFRQDAVSSGINTKGSILDYYTYNANSPYSADTYGDRWSIFREDLAWNTYLIDYDSVSAQYFNFVTDDAKYGETQRKSVTRKGGTGTYDFSFAGNINDFLYFGATLGVVSASYQHTIVYEESGFADIKAETSVPGDSMLANPTNIEFSENLYTQGSGVNFKFGLIMQPVDFIRIGASIHSSTFYNFTDEYHSTMYSKFASSDTNGDNDYFDDSDYNLFDWRLQTPFRANLGLAFIFKQKEIGKFYTVPMIFSLDYEYVDYSRNYMKSYNFEYSFDKENTQIKNNFAETHAFRAGAELNFGSVKVRGGYSLYTSPTIGTSNLLDNARTTFSGGIGFGGEHAFLDLAYSYSMYNETMYMYDATNQFPLNPIGSIAEPQAQLSSALQFIQLTLGFRF